MKAAYGVSKSSDSKLAAQEAVDACMARLEDAAHAFAVMVYFGIDHDAAVIATTLAEKLPNVTVVGCSTDGEISSDGLSVDSVCVCILSSTKTTARAQRSLRTMVKTRKPQGPALRASWQGPMRGPWCFCLMA
ncbi:FIST N-terminal domain-containing protein [Novosphingobium sp.]|uniref:FIST N-terminal domain-containing protein n=1 Tax=Novosphingobium sp. TaxID=1874826 RepID=UPI003D14FB06